MYLARYYGIPLMEAVNKNSVFSFVERYKLHHILFWACYHFVWWTVYMGNPSDVLESFKAPHGIIKYLGYVIYQAFGIYFCLYVLVPNYLIKGKYFTFFAYVIFVVIAMALLISSNYFVAASFSNSSAYALFKINPATPVTIFKKSALPSSISAMTLGMSIKLAKKCLVKSKQSMLDLLLKYNIKRG